YCRHPQQVAEFLPVLKIVELDIVETCGARLQLGTGRSVTTQHEGHVGPVPQQARYIHHDLDSLLPGDASGIEHHVRGADIPALAKNRWRLRVQRMRPVTQFIYAAGRSSLID